MSEWQKNKEARRMAYGEKLKDPRWQKMRLEIFKRHGWACRWCHAKKRTLAVHHLWYETEAEPWEATPESLLTVCESCHQTEYDSRAKYEALLLEAIRRKGFSFVGLMHFKDSVDSLLLNGMADYHAAAISLRINDILLTEEQTARVIKSIATLQSEEEGLA